MSDPPRRAPWLVSAAVGGETVIYDPVRDGFHVLNPAATVVWDLLDGRRQPGELARAISEHYSAATAAQDVVDVVGTLRAGGLLLPAEPHEGTATHEGTLAAKPALPGRPPLLAPAPVPSPPGGWDEPAFRALDYVFTVDGDDRDVAMTVRHALRDLRSTTRAAPVARYWLRTIADTVGIEVGGQAVSLPAVPERVAHLLLWHVNRAAVQRSVDRHVILHAAAVDRDGAVVLLPGGMERGKTTTAAGLVRAGYRYLSDELAAIEPASLCVRPYPKPLGIDPGSQHVLAELRPRDRTVGDSSWQVPATAIRPDALADDGHPAVIITPEYDPRVTTRLEPLSPGEAVVRLADCAFGFKDHPQRDLGVLARLAETCVCYRLPMSVLDAAVSLIDAAVTAAMRTLPHSTSARGT